MVFCFLPWTGIYPACEFYFTTLVLTADYKKSPAYTLKGTQVPESILNNFQNILLPIIIC